MRQRAAAVILFIHGFASCGLGAKSRQLIRHFGERRVLAPDLPFVPSQAIKALQSLIAKRPIELLVGSSLGGYYATWLNRERPLPTVLINPAVRPWELLQDHLGTQRRWCDGAQFEFTHTHAEQLRHLSRPRLTADERYLVLLQTGDEVLDYRQAARFYADQQVVVQDGGNHRFENLAHYLPAIDDFHQTTRATR